MWGLDVRLFRTVDFLTLGYIGILSTLISVFHSNLDQWGLYLLAHILYVLLVIILIHWAAQSKSKFVHFFRDAYALLSIFLFYEEVGRLTHLIFPITFEHLVYGLELAMFKTHPTVYLQNFVRPWLTEYFFISYFSYFFLIIVPAIIIYIKAEKTAFYRFSLALLLAYYVSFLCFILFPIEIPRFALKSLHSIPPQGYAFTRMFERYHDMGAFNGCAMPSSHVAATFVSLMAMRKFNKKIYYPMLFLVISMIISTIYCRYHYFLDAVAGVVLGYLISKFSLLREGSQS